MISLIIGRYL